MMPVSRYLSALAASATAAALVALPAAAQQRQPAASTPAQTTAATLPGGASSVQETYGSWTVSCRLVEGRKACALAQVRGNQQTGQRSFAVELQPPREGKTEGVLVLPFGLALSAGVKISLDDKPLGQPISFSTCVPNGCLAPVSFPTSATDAMKNAKAMAVATTPLGGTEPAAFEVPLDGFGQALSRVAELAK
jgi:invasion protein IalB